MTIINDKDELLRFLDDFAWDLAKQFGVSSPYVDLVKSTIEFIHYDKQTKARAEELVKAIDELRDTLDAIRGLCDV